MRKFKVGDKVKVINSENYIFKNFNIVKNSIYPIIKVVNDYVFIDINNDECFVEGYGYGFWKEDLELVQDDSIKSILFNNPYTTVLFNDGSKSIVKCHVNDEFDEYQGFVNAVAKHTLQMSGLEIAELIDSKAKRKQDNVIRVGDKVVYEEEEYYVTHIDDASYHKYPYKLSKRKEDIGLDVSQLKIKYGYFDDTWAVSTLKDLTKVKSK